MSDSGLSRRALLGGAAAALAAALPLGRALMAQEPDALAGQGNAGSLRDPSAVGRPRVATSAGDNDETIKRIEHQLRCTCGCNLDVFTCRTTDFTCTYSPELHREVVALAEAGRTPQQVVDAFVAKYGERVLMAPKPVDFNLVGYLLPGAAILVGGAGLAWVIGRRRAVAPAATGTADHSRYPGGPRDVPPTGAELERLQRALAQVED
jgi:cytochrome c-type biogenesis protein CcmH/NrfF